MPPEAATVGDAIGDSIGGPQRGSLIDTPNAKVQIEGKLAVVVGAHASPHGGGPHAASATLAGSTKVTISGLPACRRGDNLSCGHTIMSGSSKVTIN